MLELSHGLMLCCRISPHIHLYALFLILDQLDKSTISNICFCAGCARCAESLSLMLRQSWPIATQLAIINILHNVMSETAVQMLNGGETLTWVHYDTLYMWSSIV